MKKLLLLSIAFYLFSSINAQTEESTIAIKDNAPVETIKQKKSNKHVQSWNLPNRKWFIEVGTPGAGLSLTAFPQGSAVSNIELTNMSIKYPSLTYYSDLDTATSFYMGYGIEYNIISGSFNMSDHVGSIGSSYYTNDYVWWSVSCFKFKVRNYFKISNKFSLSSGVGFSSNISNFSSYGFHDYIDPNIYYDVDGVKTESYTFVWDLGAVWEATKWLNLGLRCDFDTFKIKLKNYTMWGTYDSFSTTRFFTISPTIRFKI